MRPRDPAKRHVAPSRGDDTPVAERRRVSRMDITVTPDFRFFVAKMEIRTHTS